MNIYNFGAEKIITQHIADTDFCSYFVGFDINDQNIREYRWKPFIKLLTNVIPEFAFGPYEKLPENAIPIKLAEAAKSIYKIDAFDKVKNLCLNNKNINDDSADKKYLSRGEFGELILHLLLRDFHKTVPLLSKIYFKDSNNVTVHGFDAVHIIPNTKTLWLGESKLYQDGKNGVRALIEDIKNHIKNDYLKSEFILISKKIKLFENIPKKNYWINLMESYTKLENILQSITIPLLCTYTSYNFTKYNDETASNFIEDYEKEVRSLYDYFKNSNDHPLKTKLNIILLLFPVQSKDELIKRMHEKLSILQSIDE